MKNTTMIRMAVLCNDTVVNEAIIDPKKGVTIGTHKNAHISAPTEALLGTDRYTLFAPGDPEFGFSLNLNPSMRGWVEINKERQEISGSSQNANALHEGDRGLIKLTDDGSLSLFFFVTSQTERAKKVPFGGNEYPGFFLAFAFAVILHFSILIAIFLNVDYNYVARLEFTGVQEFEMDNTVIDDEQIEEFEDDDSISKKAGGEEGKFGQEDKIEESKVPKTDGEMADRLKTVGVAKVLNNLSGSTALSSLFSNNNASDLNALAMGGAAGELVMGHGAGGMGMRGVGGGGGGEGFGRIHGVGNLDTGGGRGTRTKLRGRGKAKKRFKVTKGKPSVGNFCKQKDIIRVVSSRQRSIQYCYEKELQSNPELKGKIVVNWLIGLNGKVMKAWVGSSALKNGSVESCVVNTIKRAKFVKPDGGICQIKFPFVFNF